MHQNMFRMYKMSLRRTWIKHISSVKLLQTPQQIILVFLLKMNCSLLMENDRSSKILIETYYHDFSTSDYVQCCDCTPYILVTAQFVHIFCETLLKPWHSHHHYSLWMSRVNHFESSILIDIALTFSFPDRSVFYF